MYFKIKIFCDNLSIQFNVISKNRKNTLENIDNYITLKQKENKPIHLVYICTHNSRRSQFGQIWSRVAADYYQIKNINTYSGGTEATSFNMNAIQSLHRLGFEINPKNDSLNTIYEVYYDSVKTPINCFSKLYNHSANPNSNFAAIMTCSDAEENCPFIPEADIRLLTTYSDPKEFDYTSLQDIKYDERCKEIALETFYVFSLIK